MLMFLPSHTHKHPTKNVNTDLHLHCRGGHHFGDHPRQLDQQKRLRGGITLNVLEGLSLWQVVRRAVRLPGMQGGGKEEEDKGEEEVEEEGEEEGEEGD